MESQPKCHRSVGVKYQCCSNYHSSISDQLGSFGNGNTYTYNKVQKAIGHNLINNKGRNCDSMEKSKSHSWVKAVIASPQNKKENN